MVIRIGRVSTAGESLPGPNELLRPTRRLPPVVPRPRQNSSEQLRMSSTRRIWNLGSAGLRESIKQWRTNLANPFAWR